MEQIVIFELQIYFKVFGGFSVICFLSFIIIKNQGNEWSKRPILPCFRQEYYINRASHLQALKFNNMQSGLGVKCKASSFLSFSLNDRPFSNSLIFKRLYDVHEAKYFVELYSVRAFVIQHVHPTYWTYYIFHCPAGQYFAK